MTAQVGPGFRRVLGPVDTTCVVIGAIVGVGIFFNPTQVARIAGSESLALLIWVLGGLVAILGGLAFAELGRLYPRAGGQYDVLRDAWGPMTGFLYVVANLAGTQAGAVSIIALITVDNLGVAVQGAPAAGVWKQALAHAMIWSVCLANVAGVKLGSTIQNVTVYAKLLTLAAIVGLAIAADPAPVAAAAAETPPAGGLAVALFGGIITTMFAYGGWQQGLWMGGEVRNPERVLPRAILAGVLVVVVVYAGAAWAFFRLLGFDGVAGAEALAAEAVGREIPGWGSRAVAGAVAFSAFGVLNAQFLSGPRLTWALAADGRFFPMFARLDPRRGTPVVAILLLGVLSSLLLIAFSGTRVIDSLTTFSVVIDAVFFVLTALALVLHWHRVPASRTRPWAFAAIPVLFALCEGGGLVAAILDEEVRRAAWLGLGLIAAIGALYAARFRTVR